MRLSGTIARVTGGGSGIGLAVVDRFVAEGASAGVLVNREEHARLLEARQTSDGCIGVGMKTFAATA